MIRSIQNQNSPQVKAIVDRFRGREGLTELDRRWTSKVTDVRNWFLFAASERWRQDNSEHEHYSDLGRKIRAVKRKIGLYHSGGKPGLSIRVGNGVPCVRAPSGLS